jgi:hypothetical protein
VGNKRLSLAGLMPEKIYVIELVDYMTWILMMMISFVWRVSMISMTWILNEIRKVHNHTGYPCMDSGNVDNGATAITDFFVFILLFMVDCQ